MPDTIQPQVRFPMPCPQCHAVTSMPFMAGTNKDDANEIAVGMRCADCGLEWKFTMPTTVKTNVDRQET